jgi:3'-phosphoadenosine 5'-phosphosulfate sulfotransferase|tara:strand:- start:4528 stop:4752 length:225 start_codon:yes stop_codon:yes gene_type:complete
VDGVKEYRDEFEPDADVLIAKFTEIQENGYTAFVRICASDVKVKNAVINALYDEMDTARATAAAAIELEKETTQ